jgi:anti-sigma B factor antagonist
MGLDMTEQPREGRRAVIGVAGRVTAATAPDLRAAIRRLVEAGRPEIVIDLSGVSFLDSSGLAALVSGLKATREAAGWLRVAAVREEVRSIFTLTMLDRVFSLYPDVVAAEAAP